MKALILAIQAALQASSDLSYIADADIFIMPDENLLPISLEYPAIGLKDGAVTRVELSSGMQEVTLSVMVLPFVLLDQSDAVIVGNSRTGKKGVLEITGDIHGVLDENLLGITCMQTAFSPLESASELFGAEEEAIQKKVITYTYVKEEERP